MGIIMAMEANDEYYDDDYYRDDWRSWWVWRWWSQDNDGGCYSDDAHADYIMVAMIMMMADHDRYDDGGYYYDDGI